jgi:predicted acyltransferase
LNLLILGWLLDNFGSNQIQIGFIRVLEQLAFAYLAAFLVLNWRLLGQGVAAGVILVAYQLLWMYNPWNGSAGPWGMGNENLGSAFDRWLLGRNYSGFYVGLNAVPSTATVIFGAMAGRIILQSSDPKRTVRTLGIVGITGVILGLVLSRWFPLIKRIWTPSFTVYAGGWTTLLLATFYWTIEVRGWKRWAFPLVVVGTNSIAAYVLGNAFGGWFRSLSGAWIGWLGGPLGSAWFPVLQHALFATWAWAVLFWLYRRRIFFKL